MDQVDIVVKLIQLDGNKRKTIITNAVQKYFIVLYNIASDIYDSCIEDFYAQYTPRKYDRHGDIEGFNLYNANEISNNVDGLRVFIDSQQLLPYSGKVDKRSKVLNSVMKGIRGTKLKHVAGWPMNWYTQYPNGYSQQHLWSSEYRTLNEIYDDFMENIISDTKDIFWSIVSSFL